jgi:hypothetical protein
MEDILLCLDIKCLISESLSNTAVCLLCNRKVHNTCLGLGGLSSHEVYAYGVYNFIFLFVIFVHNLMMVHRTETCM